LNLIVFRFAEAADRQLWVRRSDAPNAAIGLQRDERTHIPQPPIHTYTYAFAHALSHTHTRTSILWRAYESFWSAAL